MPPLTRTLVPVLLIVCGILAGFFGYRSLHRESLVPVATASAAAPAPSVPPSASAAPPAASSPTIPDLLPDARIPDLQGAPHSLSEFRGHPLVVNFWATWCAPCRREMPLLQSLWQQHRSDGVQVVGVAVDARDAVQQYLHTTPVGYPILADADQGSAAISALGIDTVLPISVFADSQGHIVSVKLGELHRDEADAILSALQQESAGHEALADARRQVADQLHQLDIQRAQQAAHP